VSRRLAQLTCDVLGCRRVGLQVVDRLANDFLDTTRIHEGKLALHPEPCDLAAVVHDVVEEQRILHPLHLGICRSHGFTLKSM
jgi:signal transduction histidine kinase